MTTSNNSYIRDAIFHLIETHSSLSMLADGLDECQLSEKAEKVRSIATSISYVQSEISDMLGGKQRLPEVTKVDG